MTAADRLVTTDAVTTGEARALVARVDAEMRRLDKAITSNDVGDAFRRAWQQFGESWRQFHDADRAGARTLPGDTWRLAQQYGRRAAMWRRALARQWAASARTSDGAVGALIVTPGAIKDELETVNAGVKQLDSDIMGSKVRDTFKKAWRLFATEWQQFYASKQSWWSRSWGATWEKAVEYRKRVDEWRTALQREGGQATGPTLNVPAPAGAGSFKWWAVGGLLVAGAVIGAKALR